MDYSKRLSEKKSSVPKGDAYETLYSVDTTTRYYSKLADTLDTISCNLMFPWFSLLNRLLSCCDIRGTEERNWVETIVCLFLGCIYFLLSVLISPIGICGIALWLIICKFFKQEKYTLLKVETDYESDIYTRKTENSSYTFGSANVLLGPEFICRINNIKDSNLRVAALAEAFVNHSGKRLHNLKVVEDGYKISSKLESLHSEIPNTDFLCLQEVWERSYALNLIHRLKDVFKYFLYDIGEYSWDLNRCMFGSGLMFASKKPILAADFKTFTYRTNHAKYTSQGVICIKVLLSDSGFYRHVGFISNLHTQAFQGDESVIPRQVTEAYVFMHMFKHQVTEKTDIVDFDVICGDFNADNMSPADEDFQHHVVFKEYCDVCVAKPGQDQDWAIGTEMRQALMHSWEFASPEELKDALIDDSKRRRLLLDADVIVHSHHLRTALADPDEDGFIRPVAWGGMRRVDRILYNRNIFGSKAIGYCFATALTNLTDHIPIFLTLTNQERDETDSS